MVNLDDQFVNVLLEHRDFLEKQLDYLQRQNEQLRKQVEKLQSELNRYQNGKTETFGTLKLIEGGKIPQTKDGNPTKF